jgi:NAD(P)H dehydrogenase (quinone)
MSPRHILVVVGHPIASSFNHELALSYSRAAEAAGAEVRVRDLADSPPAVPLTRELLRAPEGASGHLEVGVVEDIGDLHWAEHVVIFFPQWWGTYPAVLKSWVDRTFLSGDAFRYGTGASWHKLLTGRTARLVMTHDSPGFYNALAYHDAAITSLRTATLGYCGIKTVGVTRFSPVKGSTPQTRQKWVARVADIGSRDGAMAGKSAHQRTAAEAIR